MKKTKKPVSKLKRRGKRLASGFLSKFEEAVAEMLRKLGIFYEYETVKLTYTLPETEHVYKPDFIIGPKEFIEVKGYLPYKDQVKMINVKRCNPDCNITFLFMYPNKKLPGRKITNAEWATKMGFAWVTLEGLKEGISFLSSQTHAR
jgi:hypothetical protein